jgi:AcrR family transcriptional regulator
LYDSRWHTEEASVAVANRPMRADAQRNREQLLAAAVAAFSREDASQVTLESVAKAAGVGIGTLYRHFPSREALVDGAYRSELARLCDSVPGLIASMPADKSMRTWMDFFIEYMTTKKGMSDALRMVIASGGNPFAESRSRLLAAFSALLAAGAEDGTLRADLDPADLLASMSGVSLVAATPAQREQAGRLLDLLMDGLRYGAARAGDG